MKSIKPIGVLFLAVVIILYGLYTHNNQRLLKEELKSYETALALANEQVEKEEYNAVDKEGLDQSVLLDEDNKVVEINPQSYEEAKFKNYRLINEMVIDNVEVLNGFTVQLYAQVEINDDGEYSWDDGQKWLLVALKDDSLFCLFEEYIQLGIMEAFLYKHYENKSDSSITSIIKSISGIQVLNYTFDAENNMFKKEIVFEKGNDSDTAVYRISNY